MLRRPKLQKIASGHEGTKMRFPKIAHRHFFGFGVTCPWAKNGGCKKHPPCGPLRVQLPKVWFWAPEGKWGCEIGKGGCPAVCILGAGYGKAHRMYFWEGLYQKKRVALRAHPA